MLKKIFTHSILFLSLSAFSQQSTTLSYFDSKNSLTSLKCRFTQVINVERKDTVCSILITYQNAKYEFMHDTVSISLSTATQWKQFINDLRSSLDNFNKKEDSIWMRDAYRLSVYKKSKTLYLCQSMQNGAGYTYLNKKEIISLIDWSQTITFK